MIFRINFVFLFLLICPPNFAGPTDGPTPLEILLRNSGLDVSKPISAIVVGGSRGIGRGFVEELLASGIEVTIISSASAKNTAMELSATYPGHVKFVTADFSDPETLRSVLTTDPVAIEALKQSQISIFSAGIDAFDEESDRVAKMLTIKNKGSKIYHDLLIPQMNRHGTGLVIYVSSFSALEPFPVGLVNYSQSNIFMVEQAHKTARENPNLHVYALTPGMVESDMTSGLGLHPLILKRWGDTVKGVVRSSIEIMAFPDHHNKRYVYGDGIVILPGNEFNMKTLESLDVARKLYGPRAADALLENSVAMQAESQNMSTREIEELINLTEQSMSFNSLGKSLSHNPFVKFWCRLAFEVTSPMNPFLKKYNPSRGPRR